MISIIIPVFNQAEHLANCLDSLKKQTFNNYEIIVVDDGSKDDVSSVVAKYKKIFSYKIFYYGQKNQGASIARNLGAKMARGQYLLFCDADTILNPTMLESMKICLEKNPGASFCYSSFIWGKKKFLLWPYDAQKLKQMPYINTSSLLRRDRFPGFDEKLKRFQDWDLWLTMSEQGRVGIWLNQILYKVNLGGRQTMSGWLPSFAYKWLPFLPAVKKYNQTKDIIMKKHGLK